MAIHHAQQKKAEKAGFMLEEVDGFVAARWPKYNKTVYGVSATEAIAQMEAMQKIYEIDDSLDVRGVAGQPRLVQIHNADGLMLGGKPMTPHEALAALKANEWQEYNPIEPEVDEPTEEKPAPASDPVERSDKGVPLDGAVAYKEGILAADCPFDPESDDEEEQARAERWYEQWDEAADAAPEDTGSKGGSVVSEKYRARYAELGHPTHCGDWLAELLNNLCIHKEGTDLGRFEAICTMNGVDLSKYKREGVGWQGRLRMTGRNLLAKKVYLAGGVLKVPDLDGEGYDTYRAPGEWMQTQRFNMPKADQAKPIPQAAE